MRTARSFEGLRESGNNRGRSVDMFNDTAGVKRGSSWCLSYWQYCHAVAAASVGVPSYLPRTGSCSRLLQLAGTYGSRVRIIPIAGVYGRVDLEYGDLLVKKRGGGNVRDIGRLWLGHVEGNIEDLGDKVKTIGGNTNKRHSREGDGVYENIYNERDFLAAVRYK